MQLLLIVLLLQAHISIPRKEEQKILWPTPHHHPGSSHRIPAKLGLIHIHLVIHHPTRRCPPLHTHRRLHNQLLTPSSNMHLLQQSSSIRILPIRLQPQHHVHLTTLRWRIILQTRTTGHIPTTQIPPRIPRLPATIQRIRLHNLVEGHHCEIFNRHPLLRLIHVHLHTFNQINRRHPLYPIQFQQPQHLSILLHIRLGVLSDKSPFGHSIRSDPRLSHSMARSISSWMF
mmetsp:Transcript_2978/g.6051  ORF Transcript_2978/g.6051 Transcript_2978/m.6051 type:complete len:230 (-) Transcript_2978:148-837(-)